MPEEKTTCLVYVGGIPGVLRHYAARENVVWLVHKREYIHHLALELNVKTCVVNSFDLQEAKNALGQIMDNHPEKFVSFHDDYHLLAEKLALAYAVPKSRSGVANTIFKDKRSFRDLTDRLRFNFNNDPVSCLKNIPGGKIEKKRYLCVAKPRSGTASDGVVMGPAHEIKKNYGDREDYTVERFIKGDEYSVEVASHHGIHVPLMIARKDLFDGTFVEKRHTIHPDDYRLLISSVEKAVSGIFEAAGHKNGLSHFEFKRYGNQIIPIENQLRMGGDRLYEVYEKITHVSLALLAYILEEDRMTEKSESILSSASSFRDTFTIKFFKFIGSPIPPDVTLLRASDELAVNVCFDVNARAFADKLSHSFNRSGSFLFQSSGLDEAAYVEEVFENELKKFGRRHGLAWKMQ